MTRTAVLTGISPRTLNSNGLRRHTTIDDARLQELALRYTQTNPRQGWRMFDGFLRSQGIRLPRNTIRQVLTNANPAASSLRYAQTIRRRSYHVASVNSCWHIDSNLKLRFWDISICGAIDGKSRLITFLDAADNLRSSTVLQCFVNGVSEYGFPSVVRIDRGTENYDVAALSLAAGKEFSAG
jgi:hypothetical protein